MASNITQLSDAIENLNLTFTDINTSGILQTAIEQTNIQTEGWIGIIILAIMSFSVILYIIKNKQSFALFDDFTLFFASLSIILDFGLYLVIWGILESYYVYIFIYCVFFCMAFISLLKKDLVSPEG